MLYKHGISFENQAVEPIPVTARTPGFINYVLSPSARMWSKRLPVWKDEDRLQMPKGGVDMLGSLRRYSRPYAWTRPITPSTVKSEGIVTATKPRIRALKRGKWTATMPAEEKKNAIVTAPAAGTSFSPWERRKYKQATARKLGSKTMEVPGFSEFALGEITVNTDGSAVRNVTGFLQNLLTAGADIYKTTQETKLAKIKAQITAGEAAMMQQIRGAGAGINLTYVIGGAAALGALYFISKKKKS